MLRLAPELDRRQRRQLEADIHTLLPEIEALVDLRVAVCVLAMSNALECSARLDGGILRIDLGKHPSAPVLRYVVGKALGMVSSTRVQHARGKV